MVSENQPDYDPEWLPLIASPGRQVRVLKRTEEKICSLVSNRGCLLPGGAAAADMQALSIKIHSERYPWNRSGLSDFKRQEMEISAETDGNALAYG